MYESDCDMSDIEYEPTEQVQPPVGLAQRTINRLRSEGLLRLPQPSIWFRPITRLPYRIGAAAGLVLAVSLLFLPATAHTDDQAEQRKNPTDYVVSVQRKLLGDRITDRMSTVGDRILDHFNRT